MLRLDWFEFDGSACIRIRGAAPTAISVNGVPAAGRLVASDEAVLFVPRFPPLPGSVYVVTTARESAEIAIPVAPPRASVVAVYPSNTTIPRNALRLYVRFSHPMREGEVASFVHLVDDAFLPGPELWDPTRRRLTLLLDPGRIKRGLVPHAERGYPLTEGAWIRLVVERDFRDADGAPLIASYEQRYVVGPDERRRVDPSAWELLTPPAGTRDPLVVRFDRSLDHGLLQHALRLEVAGDACIGEGERSWSFTPASTWTARDYELEVDTRLEDVAGNSVRRVFDRDLTRRDDEPLAADTVTLAFDVRSHAHSMRPRPAR